jgi:DNA polymerase I-like protein with 3'-5' exonuclease and polymerase domains/uracil-DNA glycosylase
MNDNLIRGSGYDQADLMIVGDYARKADASSGYCLSSYYKNKLDEVLKLYNYTIDQTYRTCCIKDYIQGLGVGTWKQDETLLKYYFETGENTQAYFIEELISEINTVKPSIIIALGEFSLRLLTGKKGIGNWRGSVLSLDEDILVRLTFPAAQNIKIVASYHPSVIHTQEELIYLIRLDFQKAVDLIFQPNRPINYHEVNIAIDLLRFIEMYPLEKYPRMTVDIETHYGYITCIGISFDGYRGITVPLYGSKLDLLDRARMMYLITQLLQERDLGNQNIGYDKRISARFGMCFNKIVWDTMLAAHTIACEFPKRLGFLTSIYTDMSYYKDEGHDFDPKHQSIDVLFSYNCKDAITAFQIWDKQIKDLKDMGMYEFFTEFVMKLFTFYYDLDSVGILQDKTKCKELISKYEGLLNIKKLEVEAITSTVEIHGVNIGSSAQIGKFMESCEFPVLRHRVQNGHMIVSTDVDSFRKMRVADISEYRKCTLGYNNAIRFINLVLLIRRIEKVLEYLNVGVHPDGRIRTSYKIGGTTSSRTSANQTSDGTIIWDVDKKGAEGLKFKQLGQSFQTITKHGFIVEGEEDEDIEEGIIGKDIREMYIPDPHWALVEGDGSQAEARVCDVLGEDWEGLDDYKRFDKHCKVASLLFPQFTYEEIFRMAKKEKSDEGIFMRNMGKHTKHGKNNGLEAFELAKRYIHLPEFGDSIRLAKRLLHQIDLVYPNIEQVFHKQVETNLRDKRQLISPTIFGLPSGRTRVFFKKIDKHYLNVAYSWLPQCTVTDHTKAAGLRITNRMDRTKVHFIAENHDSLTALVHRTYIRKYCNIAKQELERPIDFNNCSLSRDYQLVIPCEFNIGRFNWGKMKEVRKVKWDES